MGLDTSFHILYGYKVNGRKLINDIQNYTSKEKDWILPNGEHVDDFEDNMNNSQDLCFVNDDMCGEYTYLGIPLMYKYDDYGEPWNKEFEPRDIVNMCSDEKLDTMIKEKIPFIVGNEYDEAGMLYGELPKLYLIKKVW